MYIIVQIHDPALVLMFFPYCGDSVFTISHASKVIISGVVWVDTQAYHFYIRLFFQMETIKKSIAAILQNSSTVKVCLPQMYSLR
jgi:hypothetical protein